MRCAVLVTLLIGCGSVPGAKTDAAVSQDDSSVDAPPEPTGPAPTFTSIEPDWGSTAGGTPITIKGTGFTNGKVTVSFGTASTNATVVSDTELTVTSPAGPHMAVAVKVTTAGGPVMSKTNYRYLAPLYAGDGRAATAGNLYMVNPNTGESTTIGAIGFPVTGMAISSDGTIYGAATGSPTRLITINPYTGAGTMIGALMNGTAAAGAGDISFHGTTLLGWQAKAMVTINTTTAQLTASADTLPAITSGGGRGFAGMGNTFYVAPATASGVLYVVNPSTGVATAGPTMNGLTKAVNGMSYVGTTLYGSVTSSTTDNTLIKINTTTGAVTTVGVMPNSAKIDAIAGIQAAW